MTSREHRTPAEDLEAGLLLFETEHVQEVKGMLWKVIDGNQVYLINLMEPTPCGCAKFIETRSCSHLVASMIARKDSRCGCEEGVA